MNRSLNENISTLFLMPHAKYTPVIDIPNKIDRSHGDVHPEGNPHVHLDPHNILLVAKELNRRLSIIDSKNKSFYQEQYNNFVDNYLNDMLNGHVSMEKLIISKKLNSYYKLLLKFIILTRYISNSLSIFSKYPNSLGIHFL